MCDRKGEGGRCFPHKEGTQAAIEMTEIMTELPKAHIQLTAKELKQEGKDLPTPSEEEVVAFAMTNQFTAKYDPRVPDTKREKIARKWKRAEKEKPNGGEFHSWKHTMVESVKRYRRTAVAALIGGSIIVTSACGLLPNNNNPAPTPEVTVSAPASPTSSPTVAPTPTETKPTSVVSDAQKEKLIESLNKDGVTISKETVSNSKGSYPKIEVDKNSSLGKFDSSKLTSGMPSGWSKKDAQEAQVFASNFMLQETIDSNMNGDTSKKAYEAWAKENGNKFTSTYRDMFLEQAKADKGLIAKEAWQNKEPYKGIGYKYVYDGTTPRISSAKLKVDSAQDFNGNLVMYYSGTYTMDAYHSNGKTTQTTDFKMAIALKKDKKAGFLIDGLQTSYETHEPKI